MRPANFGNDRNGGVVIKQSDYPCGEVDNVESLLSNLNFHQGRQAHTLKLLRKKISQGAYEEQDELDESDLDLVAGGLHRLPEGSDPHKPK